MLRWFRLLVIALLLPAYGLAAISVPSADESSAPVQIDRGDEPAPTADDVAALIAELGDTTDDLFDHCLPDAAPLAAAPPPAAPVSLGRRLAIDARLARPLRPPRA